MLSTEYNDLVWRWLALFPKQPQADEETKCFVSPEGGMNWSVNQWLTAGYQTLVD